VLLAQLSLLRLLGAKVATRKLRPAYWLVFLLLGGLLALAAPGAIIYFLFPPAVVLIGIAVSRWHCPAETIGALVALLLLYLSWGEMLAQLEEIFSPGPLWVVAPVASLMVMPALIEAHRLFVAISRHVVLSGTAIIALIAWAIAGIAPAYSLNREQRFTIEHLTQFPSRKSSWSILNDGAPLPDSYSGLGQWHRGKLPFSERQRWLFPAPPIAGIEPPSIQPIEILRNGTERRVRLRIHSDGAERIALIAPAEAHLRSAGLNGFIRPIGSADSAGKFTIACTGRSCDGADLAIDLNSAKPVVLTVVGARNGLPAIAGPLLQARPELARPQYVPDETVTISRIRI
jgi:hypothetical protein